VKFRKKGRKMLLLNNDEIVTPDIRQSLLAHPSLSAFVLFQLLMTSRIGSTLEVDSGVDNSKPIEVSNREDASKSEIQVSSGESVKYSYSKPSKSKC
jgi:hypothetical protein